jgi:hypothetical protein
MGINAVIDDDYSTSVGGSQTSFSACSLAINAGYTINVDNNTYVEVENNVAVDGALFVDTKGSFVQNSDAGTFTVNSGGNAKVLKYTADKQAWYYYTYWSSPVVGATIGNAFPNTPVDRRFWFNAANYLDIDGNDIDDNGDDWTIAAGTDVMPPGIGYAVTSGASLSYPGPDSATFIGPFNTGDIATGIVYNAANVGGSWNLLGNPYPSAVDFVAFQAANSSVIDGAHTTLVPVGYLYGIDRVRESLEDEVVGKFLKDAIFKEICPTLDFSDEELNQFSNDVLDRFRNPYLEHELMSISLNSVSKYKTRVLPSVLEFIKRKKELPTYLLFSLAALIAFYKGDRNGTPINLKDDQNVLDFFKNVWDNNNFVEVVAETLSNTSFLGMDLTEIDGLQEEVTSYLEAILKSGMKVALQNFQG